MNYQGLYEKLQGLRVLNLLDEENNLHLLEIEFSTEYLYIDNISLDLFTKLDDDNQRALMEVIIFHNNELTPLIDDNMYNKLKDSMYVELDDRFQVNLDSWEQSTIFAKPHYNEIDNLNAIKLWNHNHKGKQKTIYERIDGVPMEVTYKKGKFVKAVVGGNDITKNAMYFNGVVKELDDPMDCLVTGVTAISKEDMTIIKSIIELENIDIAPTVKAITSQLIGRNEELFEHISFIADNIHIIKIHHTGENVV